MEMHGVLRAALRERRPCMLATVTGVDGHAYRKTGAAMLFTAGGGRCGSLSPGCLENDLQERLDDIWRGGFAEQVDYDLRPEEDAVWGETIGCGGAVRILLEPVTESLRGLLLEAKLRLDEGFEVRFDRRFDGDRIVYGMDNRPAPPVPAAVPLRSASLAQGSALSLAWRPQPRLILFGAGSDAEPIAELAYRSGFRVAVADWREQLCREDRFPQAEAVLAGTAERVATGLGLGPGDYVVVCSHQLERDRRFLQLSLEADARYIGVLGSARRIAMLFDGLPKPPSVHAPVGLPIGAEGPYQIAVSIAAQLIAVYRQQGERKESPADEAVRYLFGSRAEPAHGPAEAAARAGAGLSARRLGASCSIG